ncbi:glycosyltransferase family 92 protein Os08g0121900 [Typha latifolia]|uniref:glycosyltransferase family 92 protein Os08g0121900 n=1 Tax=Typha latifolia TaxID=4733 RepID=UPI003C2D7E04
MRLRLRTTSLFSLLIVSVVLFVASMSLHVSRDLLSSSTLNSIVSESVYMSSSSAVRELLHQEPSPRVSQSRLPYPAQAVLLPDWEALLLYPRGAVGGGGKLRCLFEDGSASPASSAGVIPGSDLAAFRCPLPRSVRGLRPFHSPRLIWPGSPILKSDVWNRPPEMIRWTRLVYEAVSTPDDVIVFAKGINNRRGASRPAADVSCVYLSGDGSAVAVATATSSAQEVFRCPHPPKEAASGTSETLRVSLSIASDPEPIPSLATYRPPRATPRDSRALMCACTMVYNAAKFLPEWVVYHAGVGVERFIFYDNGSEDDLESAVARLNSEGFNVSTRHWPWPKTQEAGFSHCAAVNRDTCQWMGFLDVDEFVFSPAWSGSAEPNRSMLTSLLPTEPDIGQVSISCYEFGPSGNRVHPKGGVTQGYTCRRREEQRHKSFVQLDALDRSLVNSVHHFGLTDGFETKRVPIGSARVNHYKYQAWAEFKVKFRRRVSTYVADWTDPVNPESKDRTPGLGFRAVEPTKWSNMFCDVEDTRLKNTTQKWFAAAVPDSDRRHRMAWEL